MKLNIPKYAAEVISALEGNGYEAYAVGGCVRDTLLGKEPNDWDITTSAYPEKTLELFSSLDGFKAIPTGISHGTVTVVRSGMSVEVTTFRIDGEYSDSRHPDSVSFTDKLSADLARRDFTVNAMAYSEARGLIDLYGGKNDLEAGIIRCVGESHERFSEDALRILRALRFSSVLDFELEKGTAEAALELRGTLSSVSKERIAAELSKLVCGKGTARIIRGFLPVIREILPGVRFDDIEKICDSVKTLYPSSAPLMLAALLADCKAAKVREILRSLRFDSATVSHCYAEVSHLADDVQTEIDIKRLCRDVGFCAAEDILRLKISRGEADISLLDTLWRIIERGECVSLAGLDIGGDELLSLGAVGRQIGDILNELLEKVITGEIQNEKTVLVESAVRIINQEEINK